jgi:hypothetical protein
MPDIRIKRGATLNLTLAFANADGTAFDLAGVTLSAAAADPRGIISVTLTVTPSATAGVATITEVNTATWPEGLMEADIVVVSSAGVAISQSFGIRVERPVTQMAPDPAPYNPILGA